MRRRKTTKPSTYEQLDKVMNQWFIQDGSQGIPLWDPIKMAKTSEFNKKN